MNICGESMVNMSESLYEIRKQLKDGLMDELETRVDISDEDLRELISERVMEVSEKYFLTLSDKKKLSTELFNSFRRLGELQELLDGDATEIMVNGPNNIFIERKGHIIKWEKSFEDVEQLEDLIQQIVSRVNRSVNMASPIADARLEDGSRVHVVLRPVALDGPVLTIRKFPDVITMERLVQFGSITPECVEFLRKLVVAGYNIFISGGTGSGKTTFLNALSAFVPEEERIITIEDSAELQITHAPNLVRLETRAKTGDGVAEISMRDLIKASLRMRPDRIIVGEVRGAEALEMLQAMNTGHDGSLSTGHANSAQDMLTRLEVMVLQGADLPISAIKSQISSAIDVLVHVGRMRDRSRKVLEISEVLGIDKGEVVISPIYKFVEGPESTTERVLGELKRVGELKNREKLIRAGL